MLYRMTDPLALSASAATRLSWAVGLVAVLGLLVAWAMAA